MRAMDRIIDKMMNDMLDAIFEVNNAGSKGGGGGIFGLLGGLFGGGRSLSPLASSAISAGRIGLFANGGVTDRPAIFGEAGPEAAVPLPDGRRIPVDMRGGARETRVKVDVGVTVDDDGKVQAYVRNMGQQAMQGGATIAVKQVQQSMPQFIARAQTRSM
jgi:hypothetical protein